MPANNMMIAGMALSYTIARSFQLRVPKCYIRVHSRSEMHQSVAVGAATAHGHTNPNNQPSPLILGLFSRHLNFGTGIAK